MVDFTVPQFGSVAQAEVPKVSQGKYMSKAQRDSNEAFDNFARSLKPGQAGTVTIPEDSSARVIMGRIRGGWQRVGVEAKMQHDPDKGIVYVWLKGSNGSQPAAKA